MFKGIKFALGKLFVTIGFRLGDYFSERGWKLIALNATSEPEVMKFATEHFNQRGLNIKLLTRRMPMPDPDEAPTPPQTFSN